MIKIISTIGPASRSKRIINLMKKSGMNIGRINMKYAGIREVKEIITLLKDAGCKVMIDINNKKKATIIRGLNFDYVAVSYAESTQQLDFVKNNLPKKKLVAKIETRKGVKNFIKLFNKSDGFMIARGDLGKNVPWEYLPIIQKEFIKECIKRKKFSITATEMLLSMTNSIRPERAEISDVANAVIDGSNALMLSEETAIGKHPVLVVKTMKKIIDTTLNYKHKKFVLSKFLNSF